MYDEDFMECARECFRQAAEGDTPSELRSLVELGLEFLRLAQRKGAAGEDSPSRLH